MVILSRALTFLSGLAALLLVAHDDVFLEELPIFKRVTELFLVLQLVLHQECKVLVGQPVTCNASTLDTSQPY